MAFVPGVGIPGAAIASGLGKAAQKGTNIGDIGWASGRGALYGGAAKGAQSLLSGFGSGAATPGAAPAAPTTSPGFFPGSSPYTMPSGGSVVGGGSSLGSRVASALGSVGTFTKNNALPIGQAASGILNAREQGAQNAIQHDQMGLQQRRFDAEQQQYLDEQERKRRIAQLLAPLYQQMMASQGTVGSPPWRQG